MGTLADDLEERFVDFAVSIIELTNRMPKTPAGKHVARQVLRSGTAPAPNYGEARAAESDADFVHKLGIVLKELSETSIWLRIVKKSDLLPETRVIPVLDENKQLAKIITASVRTTKARIAGGEASHRK